MVRKTFFSRRVLAGLANDRMRDCRRYRRPCAAWRRRPGWPAGDTERARAPVPLRRTAVGGPRRLGRGHPRRSDDVLPRRGVGRRLEDDRQRRRRSRRSSTSMPVQAIGALAVAPSESANRVGRHGRGVGDSRQRRRWATASTSPSTRARPGRTWACRRRAASAASSSIRRIPNIVFVCALGRATGPQQERGVYRTTDGGTTWKRVLVRRREHRLLRALDGRERIRTCCSPARGRSSMHTWAMFSGGAGQRRVRHARRRRRRGSKLDDRHCRSSPVGKIDVAIAPSNSEARLRADSDARIRDRSGARTTAARRGRW